MRLHVFSECVIHVFTQQIFTESLLCANSCGWPQAASGERGRQMPLPLGGYTKSELSDELGEFPVSTGPQESYVYPETDRLAFLTSGVSVKLLNE